MTFSIAARCPDTGMLGVAIATAVPAVGSVCPFVASGVGAVVTQSWTNPYLGLDGLDLLEAGLAAEQTLAELIAADSGRDLRQLGIVDARGGSAAYSGTKCADHYGHRTGPGYSVQGNMLTDEQVLDAMADSFVGAADVDFPQRLIAALQAGERAGGDRRGRQSAAIKVYARERYPYMDLRVDDHFDPVEELLRIGDVWRAQILPSLDMMPRREQPRDRLEEPTDDNVLIDDPARLTGDFDPA